MKRNDVIIKAQEVILQEKKGPKPKNRRNNQSPMPKPPPKKSDVKSGQQFGGSKYGYGSSVIQRATQPIPLSDNSRAVIKFCANPGDPNNGGGEVAKIPDGACKQSVGGVGRVVRTMITPFQDVGNIAMDGKTYSVLIYTPPTLRMHSVYIVKSTDGELTYDEIKAFSLAFASIPLREAARYPAWISVTDTVWFTITPLVPLTKIESPPQTGSTLVDDYRTIMKANYVFFNTPDLINQGMAVVHRTNTNYTRAPLEITRAHANGSPFTIIFNINGSNQVARFNINQAPELGIVVNLALNNVMGNLTANYKIVKAGTDFEILPGQLFNYTFLRVGDVTTAALVNVTTNESLVLWTGNLAGNLNYYGSIVLERLPGGEEVEEAAVDIDVNLLILPPFTQADIYQQNPGAGIDLFKTTGKASVINTIMDPVYQMHPGSDHHKVVIVTRETDILPEMVDPLVGWNDNVYPHISSSVMNFQSIPWAAKLVVEEVSTNELVSGQDSILGWVIQKNGVSEPGVVEVIKEWADSQPAGYVSEDDPRLSMHEELLDLVGQLQISDRNQSVIKRVVSGLFGKLMGRVFPGSRPNKLFRRN